MTRRLLWAERGLLFLALPGSLLFALVPSPAWAYALDPAPLLPPAAAVYAGHAKLAAHATVLVVACALAASMARQPVVPLGLLVALVLSFTEARAAAASWQAILGFGAGATGAAVHLGGALPVAILLAACALRAHRRVAERIASKRLPEAATRAALAPAARAGAIGLAVSIALALALALALPLARAPETLAAWRPVGLLVGAALLVVAFGSGAGWFHRKPLAGELVAAERAPAQGDAPPSP